MGIRIGILVACFVIFFLILNSHSKKNKIINQRKRQREIEEDLAKQKRENESSGLGTRTP